MISIFSEKTLEQRIAEACRARKPARVLKSLRKLLVKFQNPSQRQAEAWPRFLEGMLEENRVQLLSENDFRELKKTGLRFCSMPHRPVRPISLWRPLILARDRREEWDESLALLEELYRHPAADRETCEWCTTQLIDRGASEDNFVKIYAKEYGVLSSDGVRDSVDGLLSSFFDLDFESSKLQLRKAADIAQDLVAMEGEHPMAQRVLGLNALLLEASPTVAFDHFAAAIKANPHDGVSYVGELNCL